ncbi:DNA repair protein RadA [Agrococcus casei]|nr:DNA repair protein RadA [Agrococcus casei]
MAKAQSSYRCVECGWTGPKWVGRCYECQAWGTVEEIGSSALGKRAVVAVAPSASARAVPITEVTTSDAPRRTSGIDEFDRVLGGGIVPGAVVLCSGEPGVGKSTLLLELASRVAKTGEKVLYVSAEESLHQVRLRAERTGALTEHLLLASETDLATVLGHITEVEPSLVIVDSVQTVANSGNDGIAGGPSQVRDVAAALTRQAKASGIPILIVGHVTKDGNVAGPRVLEHLVDVVAHFDGDRQSALRFIRTTKNRFGPTDEVGCFEMTGDGIREVPDPSELFLSRQPEPMQGTCVTVAMEGRRAIPVEIQALVSPSSTPNPRRVVNGVDGNRVAMILAVLQRHTGVNLAAADVYVSTVGGLKLVEPATDLAIAIAIASSARAFALPHTVAAIGEISLAGEVRRASVEDRRTSEAARLGYRDVISAKAGTVTTAVSLAKRLADAYSAPAEPKGIPDF